MEVFIYFEDGSRNTIYIFWGGLPYQGIHTNPGQKVGNLEDGVSHSSEKHRPFLENMSGFHDGTDIFFSCLDNVFWQKEDMEHFGAF